ncbi:MAG: methyltransferase domain-containing protein [Pseudomonadota bacterium]|nr:methyltransferase domain-containing protein [Pseudomonadota bacterium]
MRLNLGCGDARMDGYLNVDKEAGCQPDKIQDLEVFPWDFDDNSVDQILLSHVLEHLGQTTEIYLSILQELYRISKPGAQIDIRVPHPRHDDFVTDPTHVRPILPGQFHMYSKRNNKEWREQGIANTPLADYLDIDFEVEDVTWVPDKKWLSRLQGGVITSDELAEKAEHEFNIIKEVQIQLKVVKE